MLASDILALDVGVRTGFALGAPGRAPESGTVVLKKGGEESAIAFSNLMAFLAARFDAGKPRMVVKEAPLPVAPSIGQSGDSLLMTYGLHAVVAGICARYGMTEANGRLHSVADPTWRKHFTGRGRWGDRALGKAKVLQRCRQLGYLEPEEASADRADACGVWDWACATLARQGAQRPLVLFPPAEPAGRRAKG